MKLLLIVSSTTYLLSAFCIDLVPEKSPWSNVWWALFTIGTLVSGFALGTLEERKRQLGLVMEK